jgi:hypothetical protein
MTAKVTYSAQLDSLFEACFQELRELPDREVLSAEAAGAVRARAMNRLEQAAVEAGRRRLAAAKTGMTRITTMPVTFANVSAIEARARIGQLATDRRYTLAARKLEEMSDEEILRLYAQVQELEAAISKKNQ